MENQTTQTTAEKVDKPERKKRKYTRKRPTNAKSLPKTKVKREAQKKAWQEGVRKKFSIKSLPQFTNVEIVAEGKFGVPRSLQGIWTDRRVAQRAIDMYVENGFKI